jgi:hypothetical protein
MCGVLETKKEIKSFFYFYIFRKGKPKPPLTPSLTYCCFLFYFFLLRLFDRCRVQITQVPEEEGSWSGYSATCGGKWQLCDQFALGGK